MSIDSSDRFTDCQQFKRTLCELDINSSQAMATFKSQAEFPKAPIIEKTTKSKCQWFCFFAISVLAFLSFKFFVAQEPVETKALKLRLWPTTVEVKWPLASKSPCQCELMSGTKTLQTQRETRSIKEHIFLFRALTPGQDYKVVLESDKARKSINFVTPLPKLTKPVLSFAINGHLFLDFSSNVKNGLTVVYGWRNEEQNSVVLNDCKDVRRSFYFNEKKREELADALVCWTVELNENTLAKGEVCAEKFVTSRWTPLKTRRRRGTLNMPLSHGRKFFFTPQDNREQMTALSLAGSGFKRLWAAKLYGHTLEREEIDFDHLRKPVITKDEKLVTLSLVNEPLNYYSRAALFLLDHQARAKRWQRLFGQEFKVKRPVQLDDKENECNQLIKGKEYFHLFQSDDISYPGQATYLLDDDTLIFNAITKKMSFLFVSFSLSERKVNWIKSCSLDKLLNSPSASPADSLSMRTKSTASRSWLRQDSKILRYRDSIYTIATHFNNKTGKHHQMLVSCSLNEKNENARVHFRFSNNKCDNWSLICPQKGIFVFALGPSIVHWSPNSKGEGAAKAIHLGKLLAQAWGDKTAPVHILVSSPQVIKGELLLVHKEIGQNPQRNDIIKTARVKHNLSGCKIKNGQLVICKYLDNVHSKCFPDDRDVFLYTYEDHCLLQLRDLLFIYRPGQRTCSHYSFPVRISYYPRFVHSLVNDDGYLFASSRVGQLGVLPLALADALKKPIAKPKEVVIQNDALKELCLQLSL